MAQSKGRKVNFHLLGTNESIPLHGPEVLLVQCLEKSQGFLVRISFCTGSECEFS